MKKIILSILAVILLCAIAYLVYLNEVILPREIKAALVDSLERATGKRAGLTSAKLDLFRGLVIKDLSLSDNNLNIISAKDSSCRFLVMPVFRKEIIVTALKLDSPQIFVERMPDNSINIAELFFKKPITVMDGKFNLTILRIIISKGSINFKDNTLSPPFEKEIRNADLDIKFHLPGSIAFDADFEIPSKIPMLVKSSGEYRIMDKEFSAKVQARDFYPREFVRYWDENKFNIPDGIIDGSAVLNVKAGYLDAGIDMSGMSLKFSQGNVNADLNCDISAKVKYNFTNKELIYTGRMNVKNLSLSNLEFVDNIHDIRGKADFSEKAFSFNDITATVLGIPVKAMAGISDLSGGLLKLNVNSEVELGFLKGILKDRFNINIPADLKGEGNLYLELQYGMPIEGRPVVNGYLDVEGATIKPEYGATFLEDVSGKVKFTQNQLIWSGLKFKYIDMDYTTSGVLTNFDKPGVHIDLKSVRLSLRSLMAINDKVITLSSLDGKYDNYEFSIQGDLDTVDPEAVKADINGVIKFELAEDKEPFKNIKDKFSYAHPSGRIAAQFSLKGSLKDILHCAIDAEVKSDSLRLYGFKMNGFGMAYSQRNGIMDIKSVRSSLYGGVIEANGMVNLTLKDIPYQINADMKGIKIEDLKKDTVFKDTDISGIIQARFGVKGVQNDLSKLNAWGKINVLNGRLWQINLFRGIGVLLFKRDFNSVVFREGSCGFFIKDKTVFTNDLTMKSDLLNLYGAVKIGFDNTISASLKAEFTDEGIDAGNVSDIAGVIERYSIIEIKGNLKEPKFKIRPDLSSIVSDIADSFF